MDSMLHSMDPEHVSLLQTWMREHVGGLGTAARTCYGDGAL